MKSLFRFLCVHIYIYRERESFIGSFIYNVLQYTTDTCDNISFNRLVISYK